jgi:hypothetical protein
MSEQNMELAAQCWCDAETERLVMIPELAIAFSKRLDAKDDQLERVRAALREARGWLAKHDETNDLRRRIYALLEEK